jgi:hypothetical protein
MPKKATAINIQTQFAESQFMFQPFLLVVPPQEAPLALRWRFDGPHNFLGQPSI